MKTLTHWVLSESALEVTRKDTHILVSAFNFIWGCFAKKVSFTFIFLFVCFRFETGSGLAALGLTKWPRLALNSKESFRLSIPSAGMTGLCHQAQQPQSDHRTLIKVLSFSPTFHLLFRNITKLTCRLSSPFCLDCGCAEQHDLAGPALCFSSIFQGALFRPAFPRCPALFRLVSI